VRTNDAERAPRRIGGYAINDPRGLMVRTVVCARCSLCGAEMPAGSRALRRPAMPLDEGVNEPARQQHLAVEGCARHRERIMDDDELSLGECSAMNADSIGEDVQEAAEYLQLSPEDEAITFFVPTSHGWTAEVRVSRAAQSATA
jgi:hypothetical protein